MVFDWRYRTALAVFCLQLMLVHHTYRSTDFEVHRNWLAITYQLPISKWYYEATSEWTLDYPPLFAWFEWAMAKIACFFDPKMLVVSNLEYDSDATVLFQRLSVCATSLVLVAAMLHATKSYKDNAKGLTAFSLVVANAGLIMVDNIHFQYNSILLGLLVWSIVMVEEQRYILSGILFTILLNMKHLFAYLGPVYFVFLLKHYVLDGSTSSAGNGTSRWHAALGRLMLLGSAVLLVCGVSFGPFVVMGQLKQVLSRLFPFARGLCHAYWAPNAWALYSFADKILAAAATAARLIQPAASANMAGGVVGISSYIILPNVGAGTCALLTLLAMLPCLVALWTAPQGKAAQMFAGAIAYANLCGFMFGYHVHEKAALAVEIPMVFGAIRDAQWGQQYMLLSTAAHVGIFPLLFKVQEVPVRWSLAVLYYVGCIWGLSRIHGASREDHYHHDQRQQHEQGTQQGTPSKRPAEAAAAAGAAAAVNEDSPLGLRTRRRLAARQATPMKPQQQETPAEAAVPAKQQQQRKALDGFPMMGECCGWLPLVYRLYIAGFVVLEVYCTLGHKALLGERLPFVPLMLTSVYCAAGVSWVWAWMGRWFVKQCSL